jgi:hypothetical protein
MEVKSEGLAMWQLLAVKCETPGQVTRYFQGKESLMNISAAFQLIH